MSEDTTSNDRADPFLTGEAALLARFGLGPIGDPRGPAALYIDLLKRAVANIIYQDRPLIVCGLKERPRRDVPFDLERRVSGEDTPSQAHTMVGVRRLENIQYCIERVLEDRVPGDVIEMGVASGGSAVFMRGVLKAHGCTDRRVFAADAFAEPPPPQSAGSLFVGKWLVRLLASVPLRSWQRGLCRLALKHGGAFPPVSDASDDVYQAMLWFLRNLDVGYALSRRGGLANVQANFARYGLLDDQVVFLPGLFSATLPQAAFDCIAVMRLDGDLYESTMDSLTHVYPKLSAGGYCIIDDYHAFADCARAVDEYRTGHGITAPLEPIDRLSVFWRKA